MNDNDDDFDVSFIAQIEDLADTKRREVTRLL